MAGRPIELVLESTLREVDPRHAAMTELAERSLKLQHSGWHDQIKSQSLKLATDAVTSLYGLSFDKGIASSFFRGFVLLAASTFVWAISVVEALLGDAVQHVRSWWNSFLFGRGYGARYKPFLDSDAQLIRKRVNFSTTLITELEMEERSINAGQGFRVRHASALIREGI
jgi:hypothetical protein